MAAIRHRIEIVPANQVMDNDAIMLQNMLLMGLIPRLTTCEGCITFLAERGLIANTWVCEACHVPGRLIASDGIDEKMWRCPGCRRKKSIRRDSFFSRSKMSLQQLILFIYLWALDFPLHHIQTQTGCNDKTATSWGNFLREVCSQDLVANARPLGGFDDDGEPIVVEIDESKYFHRKYHRGTYREGHWVFGAVERGSGRFRMEIVEQRNRATLEPIIQRWCLPGSHIISDGWAAYAHLDEIDGGVYLHDVVVHEVNFVDPVHNWLHTNTIEGKWMHAKRKLRRQCGTNRELFPSYLDEFLWRNDAGPNKFGEILKSIRQFYPVG